MLTLFASYKLIVLTRMVWSVLALALGAVIGKYSPSKNFQNLAIVLVTSAGALSWFLIYLLTVIVEMELLLGVIALLIRERMDFSSHFVG